MMEKGYEGSLSRVLFVYWRSKLRGKCYQDDSSCVTCRRLYFIADSTRPIFPWVKPWWTQKRSLFYSTRTWGCVIVYFLDSGPSWSKVWSLKYPENPEILKRSATWSSVRGPWCHGQQPMVRRHQCQLWVPAGENFPRLGLMRFEQTGQSSIQSMNPAGQIRIQLLKMSGF